MNIIRYTIILYHIILLHQNCFRISESECQFLLQIKNLRTWEVKCIPELPQLVSGRVLTTVKIFGIQFRTQKKIDAFFFPTNSLNIFIQFLFSIWKMYACLPYGKISMYKYMQITHNTPVVNDGYIEEKKQGLFQYVWQAKMQKKIFATII